MIYRVALPIDNVTLRALFDLDFVVLFSFNFGFSMIVTSRQIRKKMLSRTILIRLMLKGYCRVKIKFYTIWVEWTLNMLYFDSC